MNDPTQPTRRPISTFNRAKWELLRQHHHIEDLTPPPPTKEPATLAKFLPGLIARLQLDQDSWQDALRKEWSMLVGKDVAAHARPGRAKNGLLVIYAENSIWMSELTRHAKGPMLKKLQDRFGTTVIRSIRLEMDPGR